MTTTFDNTEVFLSEATAAREKAHDAAGAIGSSLLSIRTDLKTFSENANPHSQGLSLLKRERNCLEQYVVRLPNHTLTVYLASYKAGENMLYQVRKPDSAAKLTELIASLKANISWPYAQDLITLVSALFKRNSETTLFTIDSYEDEWSMIFSDQKNRTQAALEVTVSDLVVAGKTSPMDKARSKRTKAPAEAAIA